MPMLLVVRRYAPFKEFGGGFEGDNRAVSSTSLMASSRTSGQVYFSRTGTGASSGTSSGTAYVGAGETAGSMMGRHYAKVSCTVSKVRCLGDTLSFTLATAGSNPMVPLAPDIDTFVDLTVRWQAGRVIFEGGMRGDNFPNAEVFVHDGFGKAVTLFDGGTSGGQTSGPMTRLMGTGENNRLGSFNVAVALDASDGFVPPIPPCGRTIMP